MAGARAKAPTSSDGSKTKPQFGGQLSQQVLEALADPVFVLEDSDLVVSANRAARALLGLAMEDGTPVRLAALGLVGQVGEGASGSVVWETWLKTPSTQPVRIQPDGRWFKIAVSALDEQRQIVQLRDVTVDEQEREAMQEMRREFLSAAAHKFTTPLTAIKMYVHLLKTYVQRADEQSPLLNQIRMLDHHLNRLGLEVNEVMDLAQLRGGKLNLHIQPVDIVGLAKRVRDSFKLNRSEREVEITSESPFVVGSVDEPRFEQVLRLLFDNADRYSVKPGPIRVSITGDDSRVRVAIQDEGVGIPREAQPMLFTPYFRAENVQTLRLGSGLGLGLYLCREIIHQHGGQIEITSAPDQGTTVTITLLKSKPRRAEGSQPG